MSRNRSSTESIVRKLREAEVLLSRGQVNRLFGRAGAGRP